MAGLRFFRRDDPTRWDVLLLFVVPTILLLGIFYYPGSEQILEYKARNPTILTIFGSNFAHRSTRHIVGNLIGLWAIGGLGFVLASASQEKRLYYFSFASYLVVVPFFADLLIRSMLENVPEGLATYQSVGFSQTVGALTGFLALVIGLFAHSNVDDQISSLLVSFGLFVSGFTVVFVNFGGDLMAIALASVIGIMVGGYVLWKATTALDKPLLRAERFHVVVGASIVFYVALLLLFRSDVGGGFFGHMAGYIMGYLLPATGLPINKLQGMGR